MKNETDDIELEEIKQFKFFEDVNFDDVLNRKIEPGIVPMNLEIQRINNMGTITDDDKDKYIFLCSLPVYGVLAGYMYKNIYDLFPIISCMLAGWSLTKKRNIIILCAVIEYVLWVIYDITVLSYTGAVTDGLVALANLILLFKKDFFKDDEKLNSLFNK